ncbi:MAG: FtsW/RodA/SpoVE family cell cycle protein [Dehalococcoidia bacterium]|nr:FtsW/RodA/SpoVE family cell cycle protein [Dehalococcoidia bacterium]
MASIGFAYLGWQALETAAFTLPADTQAILTQFAITALAGHLALRVACPEAPGQPYAVAMMLAAIGLIFVFRLAPEETQDQANWISLGTVLLVAGVVAGYRYEVLRRYKYTAALGALFLLFVTGLFGETINGARLWIHVAGNSVQTTEFIKVGLVIFLAGYLADQASVLSMPRLRFGGRSYSALPYLVPLLVTWFAMIAALALLRDLGSVALLLGLAAGAIYIATGRLRYLVWSVAILVLTGAAGYLLFDHAQVRIDTWLDPFESPQGAGFQTAQSTFAIQAGGITGEGLGQGRPGVIPAAPTDYVYSAIAEELGLVGALAVVALFALLVVSGLRIALRSRDTFGAMLASCISLLIGIQALIIIGGNLRLIPTTGITLPLVSYGGSSIVVNLILLGLLLGIAQRSWRGERQDQD